MINSSVKPLAHLSKNLTLHITKSYVKQADIDEISKNYGESKFEKLKKFAAIFQHIGLEGFKGLKQDMKLYSELKKRQQNLDSEQTKQLMRISQDFFKLGPLFIIQILPFSGPLFMLYMYTYPGSIPSWFMIDYYHDRHEELKLQNQTKALKYFQDLDVKAQNIKLNQMNLRQLRNICLLLFGIYRDGTVGYRKLFNTRIEHLFSDAYSKYLIKRYMQKRFRRDLILNKHTNQMTSLEEMVRWKYQQIINGQFRFQYKPMYQKTLQKMTSNQGEESVMFKEITQDNLDQNNQKNQQNHQNSQNHQNPQKHNHKK